MSFNPPPLPPGYGPLQVWWEDVRQSLKAELGSLQAAEDALAAAVAAQAAATAAAASAASALSDMPELAPITFTADYLGAIDPPVQLPKTIRAYRYQDTTDVSASSTWDVASATDAVTASIDATGLVTITDAVGADTLTVTSTYNGVDRTALLPVSFTVAPAPATGTTSGTTSTDSTFSTFSSTSMMAVSNELTATVGSAGQVQLSAPLGVTTYPVGSPSLYVTYGIWKHWNGTSYVDVGTEVTSSPSCRELGGSGETITDGHLSVSNTVTGLTPAATEKFQFYARKSSGSQPMSLYGTASVVGS